VPSFPRISQFKDDYSSLRWNLLANFFDGSLYAFGMSFVTLHTVLPVLVDKIGGGNVAIGLITVIWTIGFNFPQILVANFVQKYEPKKRLVLMTSMVQRIPWFLLSVMCFFLIGKVNGQTELVLFFVLFGLAAVGGSINLTAWFSLVMRITPVRLRGRLFAARAMMGALLGIIGGLLVTDILGTISYPDNFGLLFLIAFACMMISYAFLITLKEGKARPRSPDLGHAKFFRTLSKILTTERNFRNFMIADSLQIASTMAGGFYTVYAIRKFSLSYVYAGTFTVVNMISMIVGNAFFGFLADKFGHRLNIILAGASAFSAAVTAILSPNVQVYFLVFVFWSFMNGLNGVSRLPIMAEISPEHELPTHIALANMVDSSFALTGVLAGFIVNVWGYDVVFIVAALLAVSSVIWLIYMFEEPRKKASQHSSADVQAAVVANPFTESELRTGLSN